MIGETSVCVSILEMKTKEKVNRKIRKRPPSTVNGVLINRESYKPKTICLD
jgi:hypothetical protein